jgi:phytoene dehydrogenase-like protein
MTPGQLFAFRPVPGYAGYETPLGGLYLCGAAAHPGGGVMGTPGLNAAREILRQRPLRARIASRRSRLAGGHEALES